MARPFANATFPLTSHDIGTVARFQLRQAEYMHELGVITLSGASIIYPDFLTGSPVIVEWGTADRAEVFVGYVAFVQATTTPSMLAPAAIPGGADVQVYCLGATFPMNEARQQIFTNMRADQIVGQVVSNYQLDSYTIPESRVWPVYSQAGLSDWAFLASIAHDVGYTLYARNAQVKFHPRTLDLTKGETEALSYDYTGTDSTAAVPGAAQVMDFSPTIGNLGMDGSKRRRRVLYDLDRRTGKVIAVQDNTGPARALSPLSLDPLFTEFVTAMSADTTLDAMNWLLGMGEDQRWYVSADATVQGDPRLGPAGLVHFSNLPSDFSGYWYITSAMHDIQLFPGNTSDKLVSSYTCQLALGRDGVGESVSAPTGSPIRTLDQLADLGTPSEVVSTAELTASGYWRSSFLTASRPTA